MARNLDDLLKLAQQALTRERVAYALIGGCARNVYAPPRNTRDVDLAVALSGDEYVRLASALVAEGFTRKTETRNGTEASDPPDVAMFSDDTGGRIDLLIAHTPFERQAIARATPAFFDELAITLPVVRIEDLIVYKLLSARPHDLVDIEEMANFQQSQGRTIDWAVVEHECSLWDDGQHHVPLTKLRQVRARLP